jgi:hypothetical protein
VCTTAVSSERLPCRVRVESLPLAELLVAEHAAEVLRAAGQDGPVRKDLRGRRRELAQCSGVPRTQPAYRPPLHVEDNVRT